MKETFSLWRELSSHSLLLPEIWASMMAPLIRNEMCSQDLTGKI